MDHFQTIYRFQNLSGNLFTKRLVKNDLEIFDQKTMAENFDKSFSEVGPKLGSKIPHSLITLKHLLQVDYSSLEEKPKTEKPRTSWWLSCAVSTYLYGAFDYMLLSCRVRVSEWIYTE